MSVYNLDCEHAMNKLIEHLLCSNKTIITKKEIFAAFDTAGQSHKNHLLSAYQHNNITNVKELLDYACACDFLIEYNGTLVAVDWTDNESEIENKVAKHKWLSPVFSKLNIKHTVVIKTTGYSKINTKTKEVVARLKASTIILEHIDNVISNNIVNSSLIFEIQTSF